MFLSVANLYPGRRLSSGVSHTKGGAVKASREGLARGGNRDPAMIMQ